MGTKIHGIGASQAIDKSGERIIIAGMDIVSLTQDATFTWEHEQATDAQGNKISVKTPDQIVGKVLFAKKIFSEADCSNEAELYFWNKVKLPYIYVAGELFDDYKESSKEVAALFRYDADNKDKNERNVINFSIEGAYVKKEGMDVVKSIARKITCTVTPCNLTAIAEIVEPDKKPDSIDSLFKTENVEIELFKTEPKVPNYGAKIGTTSEGVDIHEKKPANHYQTLSASGHREAASFHQKASDAAKDFKTKQQHHAKATIHNDAANHLDLRSKDRSNRKQALSMSSAKSNAIAKQNLNTDKKLFDPNISGNTRPSNSMKKALTAGSGIASPSNLVGGAALASQSLDKKIQKVSKKSKSDLLSRAEQEYENWSQRPQFESFMRKALPNLTKTEIKVLGQGIVLNKSLSLEKALSKIVKK